MKVKTVLPNTDTSLGDELVASLAEGMAILRGEVQPARFHPAPAAVDVRAIRKRLGLSQSEFARRFGFGVATVRDWEQGRYQPNQTARSYLLVIEREPEIVGRALQVAAAAAFDHVQARQAADDLLRASKGLTLGGLSIKELASDGRR